MREIQQILTTAFRDWMVHQEQLEDEDIGIRKFRMKIRAENADKCIVFCEDRYGIFYLYEILILSGTKVLKPYGISDDITKDDILLKYGVPPD